MSSQNPLENSDNKNKIKQYWITGGEISLPFTSSTREEALARFRNLSNSFDAKLLEKQDGGVWIKVSE